MADPGYVVDGVLTDGEAWVALATDDVTGTSTTIIAFESTDDGQVGDWSQYMDLFIVFYAQAIYAADTTLFMRYNLNDDATGGNYANQFMEGNASSASAQTSTASETVGWLSTNNGASANVFGAYTAQFYDINSGKAKSSMWTTALHGGDSDRVAIAGSTWRSSGAPITKIEIYEPNGFAFVAGSQFSLFGILPRMVA